MKKKPEITRGKYVLRTIITVFVLVGLGSTVHFGINLWTAHQEQKDEAAQTIEMFRHENADIVHMMWNQQQRIEVLEKKLRIATTTVPYLPGTTEIPNDFTITCLGGDGSQGTLYKDGVPLLVSTCKDL